MSHQEIFRQVAAGTWKPRRTQDGPCRERD